LDTLKLHRLSILRSLVAAAGVSLLAACTQLPSQPVDVAMPKPPVVEAAAPVAEAAVSQPERPVDKPDYPLIYADLDDSNYRLPAISYAEVDPRYLRQEVDYHSDEPAGSIVVDTETKFLYFILKNDRAIRYGVSLGAQGRAWKGRAVIQWKRKWPTWTPTPAMIGRNPKLSEWKEGMPPGLSNPLGARALYIFQDGQDTLYRIHGSPEWRSIGKNASSGCVRMFNQDIIDLYDRVRGKAILVVK
jgi:lipoprotein-anchoring transpeptidase ErfK/SrfK